MKTVSIWSFSGPYFSVTRLNTEIYYKSPYSIQMLENTDQKNFLHSVNNEGFQISFSCYVFFMLCINLNCVKYARTRICYDPYFRVEGQNLCFCPYKRICEPEQTCILACFRKCWSFVGNFLRIRWCIYGTVRFYDKDFFAKSSY